MKPWTWSPVPLKLSVVAHTYNPSNLEGWQEDPSLRSFSPTNNLRPVWATRDPVEKKNHKAEWGGRVREGAMRGLEKQKEDLVLCFCETGSLLCSPGCSKVLSSCLSEGIGLQVYININSLHSYPQFLVGFACLH